MVPTHVGIFAERLSKFCGWAKFTCLKINDSQADNTCQPMEEEKNNHPVADGQDDESRDNFFSRMVSFSLQKFLGRMQVAEKKARLYEQEIEEIDKTQKTAIIRNFIRKTKNI